MLKTRERRDTFVNAQGALQGVLSKRSTGLLARWQKRHFIITGHTSTGHHLTYFKDKQRRTCLGSLPLMDMTAVSCEDLGGVGARSIVVQFEEGSNLVVSFSEYSIAHVCLLG